MEPGGVGSRREGRCVFVVSFILALIFGEAVCSVRAGPSLERLSLNSGEFQRLPQLQSRIAAEIFDKIIFNLIEAR